jgi:transcription elongation factor GreB
MGRYRPPAPKSSPYITKDGYEALQAELKALWKKRAEVTKAVTAAAAEGDRSENAEYIYRKKQLREIDRRIGYLQKRLPVLKVVSELPTNPEQIFFGAIITLDDGDTEVTYRIVGADEFNPEKNWISMDSPIVGADEFNPEKNWISMDSPMAKALMTKTIDDEVDVETPGGKKSYVVLDVAYEEI